jgi:UDP-glucose 4-epimerase
LRSASLRYFSAAGADIGGEIGEAHEPETHLLPLAVDATLGLGPSLTLLGDDYPTPDGSCVRDFIHVSDLADAHLRALHWLQRAPATGLHEQFNVGSGSGYSVRQVMAETARIAGLPVPHTVGPRRLATRPAWSATSKSRIASSAGFPSVTSTSRSKIRCVGGGKCRVEAAALSTRGKQGHSSEPHFRHLYGRP